jgi:hypothetical protein
LMKVIGIALTCIVGVTACSSSELTTENPGGGNQGGSSTGGGNNGGGGTNGFQLPDATLIQSDSGGGVNLSSDGPNCGIQHEKFSLVPVDLLVIQDRSGSMRSDDKWNQVTMAVNEVVSQTEASVRWGLKLYAMTYKTNSAVRCFVPDGIEVPFALNNSAKIKSAMNDNPPPSGDNGSATPTRFAIEKAVAHLATVKDGSPKYILLATDGQPNCAKGILSTDDYGADDKTATIAAIAKAKADGILVVVVGIAIGTNGPFLGNAEITLNSMAEAGGMPRNDTYKYYPANDAASLVTALKQIVGILPTCTFSLASTPPDPTNVAVDAYPPGGGAPSRITNQDKTHTEGWDFNDTDMTSIRVYGKWCEEVMSGKIERLQAIFGCPGVPIP